MYTIGQVIFVVLAKKSQVYPMQVVEVITKKTLQGEDVRYVLQAGSSGATTVMLDELDGEIFDNAEKARSVLVKRATTMVNKIVDAAVSKSKEWYGTDQASAQTIDDLPDFTHRSEPSQQAPDATTVMLPDGTVAKIKLPDM
jgi:hypothetical protein